MRSVLLGLVALSAFSVSLPTQAGTTAASVVAACTPAPATLVQLQVIIPSHMTGNQVIGGAGSDAPLNLGTGLPAWKPLGPRSEVTLPDLEGIEPRFDVALAPPSSYFWNARRVTIEETRVAQNGGGGTSTGVSSACSAAIAQYVAELKAMPGATTAAIEAGLSDLVYKLATTSIPNGGGAGLGAAILLVASNSTNGNLKYNAEKLAADVKDGKLDNKPNSPGGLTSVSLN